MKKSILLVGAGGHAESCVDIIEQQGVYEIIGFVSNDVDLAWTSDYPVLGSDELLQHLCQEAQYLHIAIGQLRDFQLRMRLFENGRHLGCRFPVLISPLAYVSPHALIGDGTIVMHGAIVNAGARIGQNSIINTRALIEHDVWIGDHCHIATGAIINGATHIGDCSFIGSGSAIVQGLTVPPQSFIKMGTVLTAEPCGQNLSNSTSFK